MDPGGRIERIPEPLEPVPAASSRFVAAKFGAW